MSSPALNQIEKGIVHLSREEQLWLIGQLAHHLQEDVIKRDTGEQVAFECQLAVMAYE